MLRAAAILSLTLLAPSCALGATYHCTRLMSETLAGDPSLMPSVVGDITLDGRGGYSHVQGGGTVALDKGLYRFESGPLMGTVGVLRKDARGRAYFHIDKSITDPPQPLPRMLDLVCYGK